MSAYIDKDSCIYLGSVWELLKDNWTRESGLEVANELFRENVKSVNYRYDEKDVPEPIKKLNKFSDYSLPQIAKAVSCLSYQSCEHPDWEKSKAKSFLDHILSMAIQKQFPEYEEKEWGAPKKA